MLAIPAGNIGKKAVSPIATVNYIPEKTQSRTAMKKVIDYVKQEHKTKYEADGKSFYLLSGQNCCPETAYEEFMATKKLHGKDCGMFFYHYVQSFSPKEAVSPKTVHELGCKLAQYFDGYEVLIATHIDADHRHNHLIINSVSQRDALKLQEGPDSLTKLRKLSDKLCAEYGLTVLKPFERQKQEHSPKSKSISAREYRAAIRGDSWKYKLISAIDKAMKVSATKQEFISNMNRLGYQVKWEPTHKYITYTAPNGMKCRDNRLHEEKYLKERMEEHYGLSGTKEREQGRGRIIEAVRPDGICHPEGTVGGHDTHADRNGTAFAADGSIPGTAPHLGATRKNHYDANGAYSPAEPEEYGKNDTERSHHAHRQNPGEYSGDEFADLLGNTEENSKNSFRDGNPVAGQRPDPSEVQIQMGRNGSVDIGDILFFAKTLSDMVEPRRNEKESKKYTPKGDSKKKKKKDRYRTIDYDMEL